MASKRAVSLLSRLARVSAVAPQQLAIAARHALSAPAVYNAGVITAWRSFTGSSALRESLRTLLQAELEHEASSYQKPEAVAHGPPAPFTLQSEPGDTLLTLKRKFGDEEVLVDCSVNMQEQQAAGDEEGEAGNSVFFNVSVVKGANALVFECESDGQFLEVRHVSYEPRDGVASDSSYTGPVYDELDETLQAEFAGYLAARGINEEVGEYLRHLVYDKEQTEYTRWLKNVADFVGK